MSRTMASKLVMDLEAHLGQRLLNRTTRKVSLTEPGAAYLERCRDILAAIEEAEREIAAQASEPVGRLRVTAPMSFGASHVATQIAVYTARHPRVSVDLVLNDRLVDLVEEGYDLAIRIGRLADSSLVAKRIGVTRLIVCASPAYLRRAWPPRRRPISRNTNACSIPTPAPAPSGLFRVQAARRPCASAAVSPATMATPSAPWRSQGSASSRSRISLWPAICDRVRSTRFSAAYTDRVTGIYAIHPSHRHVPLKLRRFIDQLATAFGDIAL